MKQLEVIEKKIYSFNSIYYQLNIWRFQQQRIVFTNGCFDLLHLGHIDYLSKAADLGDRLIVGLNSDSSVKALKGNSRPLQDENSRLKILASLSFVDAVIIFHEETPINLIEIVQPDILVKGGDYSLDKIVGANYVHNYGGTVLTIPFVNGYSTTAIEEKIAQNFNREI